MKKHIFYNIQIDEDTYKTIKDEVKKELEATNDKDAAIKYLKNASEKDLAEILSYYEIRSKWLKIKDKKISELRSEELFLAQVYLMYINS